MQAVKETAQRAAEAVQEGAAKAAEAFGFGTTNENGEAAAESDLQPPEPDTDLGQAEWPKEEAGPLQKMKQSAANAVEGVKHRLHLSTSPEQQATAEQRTGESQHMAKASEGRNQAQDNPINHALHEALKPETGEKAETSDFPETLNEALAAAQMRDLPKHPEPSASSANPGGEAGGGGSGSGLDPSPELEGGGSGVGPAPPSPFSAGPARSKL